MLRGLTGQQGGQRGRTPYPPGGSGFVSSRHKGPGIQQAQAVGQHVIDAPNCLVKVGMETDYRYFVFQSRAVKIGPLADLYIWP